MATTLTTRFAPARSETHHHFGAVAIAFCTRFVEAARQRREERRMLLTMQDVDHTGVLADLEMANRVQRG